jgi:hypothetical protein
VYNFYVQLSVLDVWLENYSVLRTSIRVVRTFVCRLTSVGQQLIDL